MKNYRAIFQISIVIFLLFTAGCQFLNKTSPSDTVATLQGGIEVVKPEIEQQLTHLPATLESLATQYAPTVDSLVTAIPATAESIIMPTEAPSSSYEGEVALVESENLAFKLPREVADSVIVSVVPADDPESGMAEMAMPAHHLVSFEGYKAAPHFHTPAIYVIPVDGLTSLGQYGSLTASTLQDLLKDPNRNLHAEAFLPFLPPFNAAQVFHALESRLESEYGQGIRYLTEYTQAYVGVDSYNIFYTYQGFSADGKYYIAAVLPINSSVLEDYVNLEQEFDRVSADFDGYVKGEVDKLIAQNGGTLLPSIEALDAMMMSIHME